MELLNVGFSNIQKTVISTIEMRILGFFSFAFLGCAYGVTGKPLIKLFINVQKLSFSYNNIISLLVACVH